MGRRVVIVAGLWFAFWMILAAVVGGLMAEPGQPIERNLFRLLQRRLVGPADELRLAVDHADRDRPVDVSL